MTPASPQNPAPNRSTRLDPPGWLHLVVDWIGRLPGPAGLVYVVMFVLMLLMTQGATWSSGATEPGTFDAVNVYWSIFGAALFWIAGYMERLAARAFDKLRPVLAVSPEEADALRWRLVVVPARPAAISIGLGIAATLGQFVADPAGAGIQGVALPLVVVYFLVQTFLAAIFFQVLYRLVRQTRLVRQLVDDVVPIDIFQPGPVHALALLTSRPGAVLLLAIAPVPLVVPLPTDLVALIVGWAPILVVPPAIAVLAFVVPLIGARARLVAQKERLLDEVGGRIRRMLDDAHRDVDAGNFSRADAINRALANLVMERDILAKLPTWPWSTATLRSFVSAILLPMAVFVAQQALSRLF